MKKKDKRANNGRKPYKDRGEKKEQVSLYFKKKIIDLHGGQESIKNKIYEQYEE